MGACISFCGNNKLPVHNSNSNNDKKARFLRSPPSLSIPKHPITSLRFTWSIVCASCNCDVMIKMGYGGKNNIKLPENTHTMYINLRDSWKYACAMRDMGRMVCGYCQTRQVPSYDAGPWRFHVNMPCRYELRKTAKSKFTPRLLKCVNDASIIMSTSRDDALKNEWMHWDMMHHHVMLLSTQVKPSSDHSSSL